MVRLKNRQMSIPYGYKFRVAQTKWQSKPGTFSSVVAQVQAHLRGNPAVMHALKWRDDQEFVELLVDAYNAQVCAKMGWKDYIIGSDDPKPQPRSSQWWARGSAVAAGVATLNDWLGAGGKPVVPELALARARVCVTCPKNEPGDWLSFFTQPAADLIKKQLARKNEMQIGTPLDDKLFVCSGCYCPLPLKVQCPIEHIKERMPASVKADLVPECWVLKEIQ